MNGTPACGTPRQLKRLLKPLNFMGIVGANFIVARGAVPTTTPDRFEQANMTSSARGCKSGADHRFSCASVTLLISRAR
ncbi:hypothetical protein GCT19_38630 [Paraburkholderia sp. CNPSo 3155]|nr:hypothetical protein [Paraburkholderia atlantica]